MQESIKAMFIFEKIFAHIETLQNTFSRHMYKMVSRGTSHTIFLATIFNQNMPESSGSMYSSILMLENIRYYHFT